MTDRVTSDFIFGTLASDDLRLEALRGNRSGVVHDNVLIPARPIPDQPTTVVVTVGQDVAVIGIVVRFSSNDTMPTGSRDVVAFQPDTVEWDTLVWAYSQRWTATLPGFPRGTLVRYDIEATLVDGSTVGADLDPWTGQPTPFAVLVDDDPDPGWLADSVIYNVFVDRFSPGDGRQWLSPDALDGFYGGTIRGVTEKIPYLADLGIDCVWLSPIFPSPSHHGYDATDYLTIEPRLGTEADLVELIDTAHRAGIRVVLDFVANHVSDRHPAFVSATTDPDAPAREWFSFRSWPDEYRSYFGLRFLPQIDTTNAAAREFLFTAAEYWLRRGVDGFRLDHAHGPTHAFWAEFRARTRAVRPDCVALGEVVETAALQRSYAGRMDGMLDFLFLQQIRAFFAFETETAPAFETFTQRHLAYFPPGFTLATFIDNHDMNRFLWVARGDVDILKMAALYQFTLPRPPIVYYGTETGLKQWHDVEYDDGSRKSEESRVPMDWDGIDTSLLAFYRDLIRVRREHPGLWAGKRHIQPGTTDDLLVVAIFAEDASATLAINRGSLPVRLHLPSGCNVLLHTMDSDPGAGWTETLPAKTAVLVLHPVARP